MKQKKFATVATTLALFSILLLACSSSNLLAVGTDAPAFDLFAADGRRVTLNDYQGKPVLLYFHMAMG
jgi:cytochrome oxidase Cu insertion factor (SCO1/SenC/PrrC family)